ncbi:MAG TPA: metal ABC transporter permease [Kineosporiaceae bacterium]|nr:metal ABC transporter permease [Kineosporiaceae bacterium]
MASSLDGSLLGMLDHPFMERAFLAGIAVALLCGVVGYLVVLRAQVFAADALSHVAFTGALGALAVGLDPRIGLFVATVGIGLLLAVLGPRGRADDVVIGTVFAWILGLGVLALSVYTASAAAASNGGAGVSILFGSIFGLGEGAARLTAAVAVVLLIIVLALVRPLIFASIDEAVAAARGVPVTALGVVFMALLGATAAEATQAVGALLLLGLLAAPAGAALRWTKDPFAGVALSAALAVGSMVVGLAASYAAPSLPPSFTITVTASGIYALSFVLPRPVRRRVRRRRERRPGIQAATP